ncbi:MAG: hypothetical protein KatS3mg010_0201 [Acidimicrobiia bacterium]|nr:MAG: hypothetical protein KatS3mg010_0201 [Acidimicrobiia bacterium]
MLTPFDDYPIHQTALPVAHAATGDPNHYDRYWFNGYREDFYFGVAMAVYPNRGIIDGAIATVHDGVQRSVFVSGRLPADRAQTLIGPLSIEIVEPLRATRVRLDAADHGIEADVTFNARTVALEEPRQTLMQGNRLVMDSTRLTQWGTWTGRIATGGAALGLDRVYGTKDRSWGVRPVGEPAGAAPETDAPADLLPVGADQLRGPVLALPLLRARERRPLGRQPGAARRDRARGRDLGSRRPRRAPRGRGARGALGARAAPLRGRLAAAAPPRRRRGAHRATNRC